MELLPARRRLTGMLLAGVFAVCTAAVGSTASARADDRIVITDAGPVRGLATPTMLEFLGIPYAAAPVGDLRFKPPRPHARWRTPFDATHVGDHCPQPASLLGFFGEASTTEDCLFLNVYAPRRGAGTEERERRDDSLPDRHPVMVWIHGGGLTVGESDTYDPIRLVEGGDVIVVTINYRLGILGFLAHPALSAESPDGASGNYGLMDQQLALRWVRRNIARFGGDPDNVTIFGESGGGLSVHAQLASPTAAGLFQRAIVESGAYSLAQPTLAEAESLGTAFASLAAVGCGSQTAACLPALPVTTLLANQGVILPNGAVPTIDGKVLVGSVAAAFASGQFNHVPVIEGSNHDESRLFVGLTELSTGAPLTAADYIPAVAATLGVPVPVATFLASFYPLAAYPPPSTAPSIALGALATDATFACNARLVSKLLAQHVPTYQYEFDDAGAPIPIGVTVSFPPGAYHSSELQYIFDFTTVGLPALTADQERLSDRMVLYWTRFARTGNPNSRGAPEWPRYSAADQFQSLVPPAPVTAGGFALDHKCALWGSP